MSETPQEPTGVASAVIDGDEVSLADDQSTQPDLSDLEDEL